MPSRPRRTPAWMAMGKPGFLVASATLIAVMSVIIWLADRNHSRSLLDLDIYRLAGRAMIEGRDPYKAVDVRGWRYLYPPAVAWLFAPMSFLGHTTSGLIWHAINTLLVLSVVWMCLSFLKVGDKPTRRFLALALTPAVIFFGPFDDNFFYGQINIILLCLVLVDVMLRGSRWHGTAIGVAVSVKLMYGIFILYLLLARRFRAAALAAVCFAGTTLIGFISSPGLSLSYWTEVLPDIGHRMGPLYNVASGSFLSATIRLLGNEDAAMIPWAILVAAFVISGLWLALWLTRVDEELLAVSVCALVAAVSMPVAWSHYWVWAVPALLVLARHAYRLRSLGIGAILIVVTAMLHARAFQWLGAPLTEEQHFSTRPTLWCCRSLDGWDQLQAALYQIATVVLVGLAFVCARSYSRRSDSVVGHASDVPAPPSSRA
jgi:alpha-1,2-mannosyltransferase